jgi:hypothetical protein
MRRFFFGEDAASSNRRRLIEAHKNYRHSSADIRNAASAQSSSAYAGIFLIVHGSEPSHDWAAGSAARFYY